MSSHRKYPSTFIAMAYLILMSGCATPNITGFFCSSKQSADDAESPAGDREELPAKDAARACLAAAEEMQSSGQVEQAIALYEKARSKDSSLKSVAHHLAALYDAQGDSTRALAEYTRAVESDPRNAALLSDFGYFYYERGNQAEAERTLRKALAIEPCHAKALCNLGMVLAALGRFDESYELFAKVIGPAAAHSNVGVLLAKRGRYDEAKKSFHQALALDPGLRQPRAFLDYLEARSGK